MPEGAGERSFLPPSESKFLRWHLGLPRAPRGRQTGVGSATQLPLGLIVPLVRERVCMGCLSFSPSPWGGLLGVTMHSYHVSCFCPDANSRLSEPLRGIFPDLHSDSDSKDVPGRLLLDMDNDTESTAL